MGSFLTGDQIGGIVRSVLAAVGGWAIGKGYIDSATATTISGSAVTIVVAAWSYYTHRQATMIKSINAADNGVKVVSESSPSASVSAPLK